MAQLCWRGNTGAGVAGEQGAGGGVSKGEDSGDISEGTKELFRIFSGGVLGGESWSAKLLSLFEPI